MNYPFLCEEDKHHLAQEVLYQFDAQLHKNQQRSTQVVRIHKNYRYVYEQ